VYRARDAKLGRDVAIKVLPAVFTTDAERVARFEREAQLLAALNHPHIATIHGLEHDGQTRFLVLELVDGETLDARLANEPGGALPVDQALRIARQIADALQAAHDKGIIHRDLKPANIALTADGRVKVLDFGLAKLTDNAASASGAPALTQSPTLTFAATQAGLILGTAAYMSPEQARGRAADKRSDIWAFGCVLFEMLAGRKAFAGDDLTDTIAAVVRGEPEWSALPSAVPPHIRTLVRQCLVKDRAQRIADIAVAIYMMSDAAGDRSTADLALPAASTAERAGTGGDLIAVPSARAIRPIGVAAIVAGAVMLSTGATWFVMKPAPAAAVTPTRFAIFPPPAQALLLQGGADNNIAISPDGSSIAYRGGTLSAEDSQLFLRRMDDLDARPAGVFAARTPFFSPDGRWIGFWSAGELKKVAVTGGPAISICRTNGPPRGSVWTDNNTIIFATGDGTTGLLSVAAGGGEPKVLTKPESGEGDHFFPSILPRGRGVIFTVTSLQATASESQLAVLDLKTGQRKTILRGASHGTYIDPGYLVYAGGSTLRAVAFDLDRLETVGDPFAVVDNVLTVNTGAANYAIARNGTLVYVPLSATGQNPNRRTLVWVDRNGREEPIGAPPRGYAAARVSPDGTKLAVEARDEDNDIWVWDLARSNLQRITFDPSVDQAALWSADGRQIIFASSRTGAPNLYRRAADGTGTDERLTNSSNPQFPTSVAPGGGVVGFEVDAGPDLALFASSNAAQSGSPWSSRILLKAPGADVAGEVSPDGHYIAYQSNESTRNEIYVRPFPELSAGRWQVSTNGGTRPVWARNGRELFFLTLDARPMLMSVATDTRGSQFVPGNPTKVFDAVYATPTGARAFDVSPDGRRFVMVKESAAPEEHSTSPSLIVVEHWIEELKARAAAR
jgi:serine/threonine-protein kinase